MATEIRIEIIEDRGETTINVGRNDNVDAVGEALGLLVASLGARLPDGIRRARAVLDAFTGPEGIDR